MTDATSDPRRAHAQHAAHGALVGALAFVVAERLGLVAAMGIERLLDLDEGWLFWLAAGAAAAVSLTRARVLVPATAGAVCTLYALVAFTPLFTPLVAGWAVHVEPRAADAIVVLSSDVTREGRLSSNGVTRLLAGLELARAGHASLLVRTELPPTHPDDRADARRIAVGTDVEIVRVGPVASTRDEAVAVAALARARGLHRVIVVTQPMHERRAAATFRAVGLDVVACSSPERGYSLPSLPTSRDRRLAFHDYVTERAAWTLYSLRGWVSAPTRRSEGS